MNEQHMALQSVRVRNFKAIVDGRTVRFSASNPIAVGKPVGGY